MDETINCWGHHLKISIDALKIKLFFNSLLLCGTVHVKSSGPKFCLQAIALLGSGVLVVLDTKVEMPREWKGSTYQSTA